MRRVLLCGLLTLFPLGATRAQSGPCLTGEGVPTDSLRAHARRLHPDVMKPESQDSLVIVALVYDNSCAVVRHALKRVARRGGGIADVLAGVFPDSSRLVQENFEITGFALLRASSRDVDQKPMIAWGILTPRGIPRRP